MRETDVFAQVADGFDNVGLSAVDVQRCGIDGQVAAGFVGKLLDDFDVYGIFVHDFAERAGKRAWRAEAVSFCDEAKHFCPMQFWLLPIWR